MRKLLTILLQLLNLNRDTIFTRKFWHYLYFEASLLYHFRLSFIVKLQWITQMFRQNHFSLCWATFFKRDSFSTFCKWLSHLTKLCKFILKSWWKQKKMDCHALCIHWRRCQYTSMMMHQKVKFSPTVAIYEVIRYLNGDVNLILKNIFLLGSLCNSFWIEKTFLILSW